MPFRNGGHDYGTHIADQCFKRAGIRRDRELPPYLREGAPRALPPWREAEDDHHCAGRYRPGAGSG